MKNLSEVKALVVSQQIIEQTYNHFRAYGERGLEGFVLWNGTIGADELASVKEAYIPLQHSINTAYGLSVTIPGEALHKLNVHLHSSSLKLLAQVHSHPSEAYHSTVDDFYPVTTQVGSFSIVVPHFGRVPFSSENCAIYRLTATNQWVQLTKDQIAASIVIEESK